jgi:hypothetical protein
MLTIGGRLAYRCALLLLGLAASVWPGGATAQSLTTTCGTGRVCYYVAIQPIDVCSSTGTGCAPFNTSSKIGNPGAATSTTPIGFVDPTTHVDITRAMWNQLGIDVAFFPIKQYNSTTFQTLHIVPCGSTNPLLPCASIPGALTSTDFLTLSQQNGISQGAAPQSPLAPQPTVVNMFFVNSLVPPPTSPGTLYGFSWIGNNGIAISANTFFPPFPLTARVDTLAHELGHNLGLDHADTFNYGDTSQPHPPSDLMTAGALRVEPTGTSNALTQLGTGDGTGTADQLDCSQNSTQCKSPTVTAAPQQGEAALSGLLNPIASSTTTASASTGGDITTALVVSATGGDMTTISAAPNSTKPNTSIFFDVTGPTNGVQGETLIGLVLTLGKGLHFDPKNPVQFAFSGGTTPEATYDHGNTGDANCAAPATQCLIIQLGNPGLPAGSFLDFSQGIVGAPGQVDSSGRTVSINDILNAGASITYKFSDGLIITSTFEPGCCGQLVSNSQNPDATAPAQIDPALFVGTGLQPCNTWSFNGDGFFNTGVCPDPNATGISDGDPRQEGGQLGGRGGGG